MKEWIKNYVWFIKESSSFISKPLLYVIIFGQLKAIKHANFMIKYSKLSENDKLKFYVENNYIGGE